MAQWYRLLHISGECLNGACSSAVPSQPTQLLVSFQGVNIASQERTYTITAPAGIGMLPHVLRDVTRRARVRPSPSTCILATLLVFLCATLASGDNLEADADFHSVTLLWGDTTLHSNAAIQPKSDDDGPRTPRTVVVTFCELQTWGPYRCKEKSVATSRKGRAFSAKVNGLRMATRYSFRVRPNTFDAISRDDGPVATGLPSSVITTQTKGFSARATLCLANSTEVEVDTGPFFGGRISVEPLNDTPGDTTGPNSGSEQEVSSCSVWGDPQSALATYRLHFDHNACGGTRALNSSAVATFLLVQESLPILTHSTRRFLVLCTAQPDTLTVSAGISLPGGVGVAPSSENNVAGSGSVEPQRVARLLRNPSVPPLLLPTHHEPRIQHLPHLQSQLKGSSGAQLVLMLALVSTVAIGSGFAAWWAVRRHRIMHDSVNRTSCRRDLDSSSTNAVTLSRTSSFSPEDYNDDFSITTYNNFAVTTNSATRSSESEVSSVMNNDAISCSSENSCISSLTSSINDASSNVNDNVPPMTVSVLQEPPVCVSSKPSNTIVDIQQENEISDSEA